MAKRYPFKHLSAYERDDEKFYFGRKKETAELYQMSFETDLILMYGLSGVGKSSLIGCGLANMFEEYEWLKISVRRGSNFNISLFEELNNRTKENSADIAEKIKILRNQEFRPIYLIFDQFEELYISGEEKEQKIFYQNIKDILSLNLPVKIIISIREEYLGYLYDFEKVVPQLFSHKYWVKPLLFDVIDEILQGLIDNQEESLISIQNDDKVPLASGIKKMFENADEKTVDLPSLQILFGECYKSLEGKEVTFSFSKLENILEKNIRDILWEYLTGLVSKTKNNAVWGLLRNLVTEAGTKKTCSKKDIEKRFESSKIEITQAANILKNKGILHEIKRNGEKEYWELYHDALAKCISEKLASEIRLEKLIKTKMKAEDDSLTPSQLEEIRHAYLLFLTSEKEKWVDKCEKKIKSKRLRDKLIKIGLVTLSIFIIVYLIFTNERQIDEYYADYVIEEGRIKGILPIRESFLEKRHFRYHFMYTKKGWTKHLDKVIYENKEGQPQEHLFAKYLCRKGESIREYGKEKNGHCDFVIRNKNGQIIYSKLIKANNEPNGVPSNMEKYEEISSRDFLGRIERISYEDKDGYRLKDDMIEMQYTYDKSNLSEIIVFGLKSVYREISRTDRYGNVTETDILTTEGKTTITYNYKGYIEKEAYFDVEGNPCLHNGVFQKTWKYNNYGDTIEIAFRDVDGMLCAKGGHAKETRKYKYDDYDNRVIIEDIFYDINDKPIRMKRIGSTIISEVVPPIYIGLDGKEIKKDKKILFVESNFIYINFIYDKSGYLKEKQYVGLIKDSLSFNDYLLTKEEFYDEDANIIRDWFKIKENPCFSENGYRKITEKYDEQENLTDIYFVNRDGSTCYTCCDTYGRIKKNYDERRNIIERLHLGIDGKPTEYDGYSRYTAKFDVNDNQIEEAYFGIDEKPIFVSEYGYARVRNKYDKLGNQTLYAYYDENGNLSANKDGVKKKQWICDKKGEPIIEVLIKNKFPYIRFGNNVIAVKFLFVVSILGGFIFRHKKRHLGRLCWSVAGIVLGVLYIMYGYLLLT